MDDILGLRRATLAPFGTVQHQVAESGEGFVKVAYAEPAEAAPAGSEPRCWRRGSRP